MFDPKNYKVKCDASPEFQAFINYLNDKFTKGLKGAKDEEYIGGYYGFINGNFYANDKESYYLRDIPEYTPAKICSYLNINVTSLFDPNNFYVRIDSTPECDAVITYVSTRSKEAVINREVINNLNIYYIGIINGSPSGIPKEWIVGCKAYSAKEVCKFLDLGVPTGMGIKDNKSDLTHKFKFLYDGSSKADDIIAFMNKNNISKTSSEYLGLTGRVYSYDNGYCSGINDHRLLNSIDAIHSALFKNDYVSMTSNGIPDAVCVGRVECENPTDPKARLLLKWQKNMIESTHNDLVNQPLVENFRQGGKSKFIQDQLQSSEPLPVATDSLYATAHGDSMLHNSNISSYLDKMRAAWVSEVSEPEVAPILAPTLIPTNKTRYSNLAKFL